MNITTFLIYSVGCVCLGISGTTLFALDKFFPVKGPAKPPTANPSDPDLRQQAVLLYYHDGAWEQAEVGQVYRAWHPVLKTNVRVMVGTIYEAPQA